MSSLLLDAAGRRRSPATMPGHHCGRPPRNKGLHYPADPPTVVEIITAMRHAGDRIDGDRLRALIVILWRSGLRISEALALLESDLDPAAARSSCAVAKAASGREVGMDHWGWEQLHPWLTKRTTLPVGSLFCVIHDQSRGRPWSASAVRTSSGTSRPTRACDDGSPRISCATPTPWRWPAKACR